MSGKQKFLHALAVGIEEHGLHDAIMNYCYDRVFCKTVGVDYDSDTIYQDILEVYKNEVER